MLASPLGGRLCRAPHSALNLASPNRFRRRSGLLPAIFSTSPLPQPNSALPGPCRVLATTRLWLRQLGLLALARSRSGRLRRASPLALTPASLSLLHVTQRCRSRLLPATASRPS